MKKLTLLSVCAFALSLGAANADTPTVNGGENLIRPERGADMPFDTNRSLEATPDTTVGSGQIPAELGETDDIVDDDVNLGEGDTAPDDEEIRLQSGVDADDDGVIEDEPLETGTIYEDTTESSAEDDALNLTTGEEEAEGLGDDELREENEAAY